MKRIVASIILIIIFAFLPYINIFHVPFHFDDEHSIVKNYLIHDVSNFIDPSELINTVKMSRYVGLLTFALNYNIHRLNVTGYHFFNVAIHIINGLLVYAFVLLTFRTPWLRERFGNSRLFSYLPLGAALLFVSHPLQSEAVTYIVQRFALLATLFYLLCLVLYIRSRLSEKNVVRYTLYVLSVLSAVCAMKSKEISFTLPVVITLYELFFFQGSIKRRVLWLIPLYATMLLIPLSLLGIDKPLAEVIGDVSEVTKVQTTLSRWEYLMTQFRVIMTYLRLVFVPINQNLDYDYPVYRSFFDPNVVLSFLVLAGLFGAAMYLLYRSNRSVSMDQQSSAGRYRIISFGILWFFITLSVESSLIPITDVIFEHRMYLPSVGLFMALGAGLVIISERLKERWRRAEFGVTAAFMVIVLLLTTTTFVRNLAWRDGITLWQDVVSKSPQKARGHSNLGMYYYDKALESYEKREYLDKAIKHLMIATKIYPRYNEAYVNLGNAYEALGLVDKAIEQYKIALQIKSDDPEIFYNLGNAYYSKGLVEMAIEQYKIAISINPNYSDAYVNLGVAYKSRGFIDESMKQYQTAIKLNPYNYKAYYNLGNAFREKGLVDEAIQQYLISIQLNPNYPHSHFNLGIMYQSKGLINKAIEHYETAVKLRPDLIRIVPLDLNNKL